MRRVIILGAILLMASGLHAQVPRIYSQFFMNPYLYNPAYVGGEGHTVAYALFRKQWAGISGSPTIGVATIHTPLKNNLAIGGMLLNDISGILMTSEAKFTGGYMIPFAKKHYLRFGLSAGVGSNRIDFSELDDSDLNDPALAGLAETSIFFMSDFGITYHLGRFNLGVVLPSLVKHDVVSVESFSKVEVKPLDNIFAQISYRQPFLDDNIAIEPHVIYRYQKFNPNQLEVSGIIHIKHVVWVGGSWRQDAAIVGLFGFKVKNKFAVGYAYEMPTSDIAEFSTGTHEVQLGIHFGTKKEHASHVSSFIKSHAQTMEEKKAEAAERRKQRLLALQSVHSEQNSLLTSQRSTFDPSVWRIASDIATIDRVNELGLVDQGVTFERNNDIGETETAVSWAPLNAPGEYWEVVRDGKPPVERITPSGQREIGVRWTRRRDGISQEVIKWTPVGEDQGPGALGVGLATAGATGLVDSFGGEGEFGGDNSDFGSETNEYANDYLSPTEENRDFSVPNEGDQRMIVDPTLSTDTRTVDEIAGTDIPLRVKKGNHLLELHTGNFVVAGSFQDFVEAEEYSDVLFHRGFHDTIVGYVSATGYYYVVIFQSRNLQTAKGEWRRVRQMSNLSKAWVITVE